MKKVTPYFNIFHSTSFRFKYVSRSTVSKNNIQKIKCTMVNQEISPYSKLVCSKRLGLVILICLAYTNLYTLFNIWDGVLKVPSSAKVGRENYSATIFWLNALKPFSCGKLFAIIGGYYSFKGGGASVCGKAILVISFLTVLTPIFPFLNLIYSAFLWKVLFGVFLGIFEASIPEIVARWSPVNEKAILMFCCVSGMMLGSATNAAKNELTSAEFNFATIFFVAGSVSMLLCIPWFMVASDEPNIDENISEDELSYIQQMNEDTSRKQPWFCGTSGLIALLMKCYTFHVLWFSVPDLSSTPYSTVVHPLLLNCPYITSLVLLCIICRIIDSVHGTNSRSVTKLCKCTLSSAYVFGIASLLLCIVTDGARMPMMQILLYIGIKTSLLVVFFMLQLVPLYVAPHQSAFVTAMAITCDGLGGILASVFFYYQNQYIKFMDECIICSIALGLGLLVFVLWGSYDRESWSRPTFNNYALSELWTIHQYVI